MNLVSLGSVMKRDRLRKHRSLNGAKSDICKQSFLIFFKKILGENEMQIFLIETISQ